MARYFAGNTLAAFFRTGPASEITTATGGTPFDSTYTNRAILAGVNAIEYLQTTTFSATGTVWFAFEAWSTDGSSSFTSAGNFIRMYNAAGDTVFTLNNQGSTGNTVTPQYWNGTTLVSGATFTHSPRTLYRYCIKLVLGTSWEVFRNGTSISSGTMTGTPPTAAITNCRLYAANGSAMAYSQVMIADYDIRDCRLQLAVLSGNSATNTGGTGTYTDVYKLGINDASAITIGTVGNKMGQTKTALTIPGTFVVGTLVLAARGRFTSPAADGKLGVRSGGTNYSSSGRGFNSGYEPRLYMIDTDPATAAAWDQTSINAAEIYEEAA